MKRLTEPPSLARRSELLKCGSPRAQNCSMGTDSRLGLVIGLVVVLAVAITYYPKSGGWSSNPANVVPSLPSGSAPR